MPQQTPQACCLRGVHDVSAIDRNLRASLAHYDSAILVWHALQTAATCRGIETISWCLTS